MEKEIFHFARITLFKISETKVIKDRICLTPKRFSSLHNYLIYAKENPKTLGGGGENCEEHEVWESSVLRRDLVL